MTEEMKHSDEELSAEDLQAQQGQDGRDREAMSLINPNLAAPVNAAELLASDSIDTRKPSTTADIDH